MAENNIEKRVGDVEARQAVQDAKFDAFMQSLNDFKQEMRDFKTEMRDRDNQRAAEIIELRQKHDADIKEMRQELDRKVDKLSNDIKEVSNEVKGIGKEVRNLFLTAAFLEVRAEADYHGREQH